MKSKGKVEAARKPRREPDAHYSGENYTSGEFEKREIRGASEVFIAEGAEEHCGNRSVRESQSIGLRLFLPVTRLVSSLVSNEDQRALMLARNSLFPRVLLSLSISNSIASTGDRGFSTLRRTQMQDKSS